ncbi:hypothetical protein [Streptomyces sp. NPDC048172]|uniref:DUF7878 domain-containing protein n=1 Tax=Streptomyces sp. NPDC048172 TaxID=3365505 RepID=UPI00371BE9E6
MLSFSFTNLRTDPASAGREELSTPIGRASCLFADFEIVAGGATLYADDAFPVAELAHHLRNWLRQDAPAHRPFSFDSMFFEDPGEIVISWSVGSWRFSSAERPEPLGSFSEREVALTVAEFCDRLILHD